jgi:hypothetical protein
VAEEKAVVEDGGEGVQFSSGQQCSVPLFARGYSDTPTPRARERRIRVQVRRRAVDMDLGTSLLLGGALFSSPARSQPRSVAPSFFLFFFEIKRVWLQPLAAGLYNHVTANARRD